MNRALSIYLERQTQDVTRVMRPIHMEYEADNTSKQWSSMGGNTTLFAVGPMIIRVKPSSIDVLSNVMAQYDLSSRLLEEATPNNMRLTFGQIVRLLDKVGSGSDAHTLDALRLIAVGAYFGMWTIYQPTPWVPMDYQGAAEAIYVVLQ